MTAAQLRKTARKRARSPSITLSNERPDGAQIIAQAKLERFANRTKHRRYTVEFSCPEFTCVCPASGFPDFATIQIRYSPKDWCVELKSLKLYINQYRDRGIFHEDVVNVILDDLVALLQPWEIEVVGDFNVRGNIKTIIRARHTHGESSSRSE
ncbi:MAG: NADPH-dependent 7-cyano-7-deazaguanine reductase QueF [Pseudomonadota bacterium]|jgi:7-cyano-7-deazaguanine reductase